MYYTKLKNIRGFSFLLFLLLPFVAFPQKNAKLDSLLNIAETSQNDSIKAYHYNRVAVTYFGSNPEKTIEFGEKALKIADRNNIKTIEASAYYNIGVGYFLKSNYPTALSNLIKSNRISEQIGNKVSLGRGLNLAGGIHYRQSNYELALQSFEEAIQIFRNLKQEGQAAKLLINSGEIYLKTGELEKALAYEMEALEIAEKLNQFGDIGFANGILAQVYEKKGEFRKALDYVQTALPNFRKVNAKTSLAEYSVVASRIHNELGNNNLAETNAREGLRYAQELKAKNWIQEAYLALSATLEAQGKNSESLEFYKKYNAQKDSIFNSENAEKLANLRSQYEIEQHETQLKLQSEVIEELEEKRFYRNIFVGLMGLVVVGLVFFLTKLRGKNKLLSLSNEEINEQREEITAQRNNIEIKNKEIQKKNKNIMSSLQYAKRIKQTLLPASEEVIKHFQDGFILLKPRDVVSGDFYWFQKLEDGRKVIAAVDCTGHGVPGALMSMIGTEQLTEIINLENTTEANKILERLHLGIIGLLKQETGENKDGMDIAICVVDEENKKMQFAGAQNPIIYFQNGELTIIKGDRKSIGGKSKKQSGERTFTKHEIDISTPTTFYLLSDGFQDQFGGADNRKFTLKRLRNTLSEIHQIPMAAQQIKLEKDLQNWMEAGKENQVDDILLMGFRVGD